VGKGTVKTEREYFGAGGEKKEEEDAVVVVSAVYVVASATDGRRRKKKRWRKRIHLRVGRKEIHKERKAEKEWGKKS
jgi:hypothetical protein